MTTPAISIKALPPIGGCYTCFANSDDGFPILGTDHEFSIAALLEKHFWFKRDEFRDGQTLCPSCWNQLDSFHRFYLVVERNHPQADEIKLESEALPDEKSPIQPAEQVEVEMDGEPFATSDDDDDDDDDYESEDEIPLKTIKEEKRQKRKYVKRKKFGIAPKKPLQTKAERAAEWAVKDNFIRTHVQFNCVPCVLDFPTFSGFQRHMLDVHETPKAPIFCCGKLYTRKEDLVEHVNRLKNPVIYQCDTCEKNFANAVVLRTHKERIHGPEELKAFACDRCSKRFPRERQLAYHTKGHENMDSGKFACETCKKRYPHKTFLDEHVKRSHTRPTKFICDICAKGFYSKSEFAKHKEEHELSPEEMRKQCDICQNWFKSERNLLVHRRSHGQDPVTCELCGHVSPNKKAWAAHTRRVHSETKPSYVCDECGKEFRRPVNLREHKVSHSGGGALYMCDFCPRTFNSNGNMFSHRKKMHPQEWQEMKNSLYTT